MVKMKKSLS